MEMELPSQQVQPLEGAFSISTATEVRQASELECHLCLKAPTDPVASSCGHVFCWPCIHHYLRDDPNRTPCPACGTILNLDTGFLTLYANASDEWPTGTTASHNVVIPGRPSVPLTFIPAPEAVEFSWAGDVSGADKVLQLLQSFEEKMTTPSLERFKCVLLISPGGAELLWLVEVLQHKLTTREHMSEEEESIWQEVKDVQLQSLALQEELAQQMQVELELEQQLAHRRHSCKPARKRVRVSRRLPAWKKARIESDCKVNEFQQRA
ncbi:hypothetical protein M758_5G066400 [Ceratodon purpureus]|nr:hypothetical protein M758_5G066400 [Ceratodon purpureus]